MPNRFSTFLVSTLRNLVESTDSIGISNLTGIMYVEVRNAQEDCGCVHGKISCVGTSDRKGSLSSGTANSGVRHFSFQKVWGDIVTASHL